MKFNVLARIRKALTILGTPGLWRYARHGVAPAIEHSDVIKNLPIATCIDVGANVGQFSALVAYLHPNAKIFAFEPIPGACRRLRSALPESRVRLYPLAVGKAPGSAELHVTNRSDSSSLLRPGTGQKRAFDVHAVGTLPVQVQPVGDVLSAADLVRPCLMKIDVQGGELDVLTGAANLLKDIDYIYVELSYVGLYDEQPLATQVMTHLFEKGYCLRGVHNQAVTPAFGATQADFLFVRAAAGP